MDKKSISRLLALILAVAVLFTVFEQFDGTLTTTQSGVSYTQFMADAKAAEAAGVSVERLQLDGMPHGFGAQGDWIPTYDQWLTTVFSQTS